VPAAIFPCFTLGSRYLDIPEHMGVYMEEQIVNRPHRKSWLSSPQFGETLSDSDHHPSQGLYYVDLAAKIEKFEWNTYRGCFPGFC
jgi:hypothetical protein